MATSKCGCGDQKQGLPPGICFPWEEKVKDIGTIVGESGESRNGSVVPNRRNSVVG